MAKAAQWWEWLDSNYSVGTRAAGRGNAELPVPTSYAGNVSASSSIEYKSNLWGNWLSRQRRLSNTCRECVACRCASAILINCIQTATFARPFLSCVHSKREGGESSSMHAQKAHSYSTCIYRLHVPYLTIRPIICVHAQFITHLPHSCNQGWMGMSTGVEKHHNHYSYNGLKVYADNAS